MLKRLLPAAALVLSCGLAAAQDDMPPIKRLDDASRAKVLAALAGLIILGFALVLLAWLGARITQRYRRGTSYFEPTKRPESSRHAPREDISSRDA
jgi:hypothetical protein